MRFEKWGLKRRKLNRQKLGRKPRTQKKRHIFLKKLIQPETFAIPLLIARIINKPIRENTQTSSFAKKPEIFKPLETKCQVPCFFPSIFWFEELNFILIRKKFNFQLSKNDQVSNFPRTFFFRSFYKMSELRLQMIS